MHINKRLQEIKLEAFKACFAQQDLCEFSTNATFQNFYSRILFMNKISLC